ncbi:MAG: metallophosphoesterase [Thermoanaerobaculaceae bacterium]|nr:metallophosphoesterase [Thermoanaerobaculaceae bacterium]
MVRAVLADLHLGQQQGDVTRFAALARTLVGRGVGEVVFLGDLFRALVGFPRFWAGTVQEGLGVLGELRAAGVRVVLVEGNRDFFLDCPALDPFRDAAVTVHSFAAGGRRFLLEHGDLLNQLDRSYRFWRTVSKSRVARLWAAALPPPLARRIVARTEAQLARTNFSYRRALPTQALAAAARRHFAAGVHTVLWGHFHDPWSFREGDCEAHVVPAWMDGGLVLWVQEDGRIALEASAGNE